MISLDRILCPTDFSATADRAMAQAVALARHFNGRVKLFHSVAPIPYSSPVAEVQTDSSFFQMMLDQGARDLAAAAARAGTSGVPIETELRGGSVVAGILAAAKEYDADLIALGTHGRSGFDHVLLGSVAEKVLRKASCPVLVVPPGTDEAGATHSSFSKVLCAFDGSAEAKAAVDFAIALARETDGVVVLVGVAETVAPVAESVVLDVEAYRRARAAAIEASFREAVSSEVRAWCHVEERVAHGKPSAAILNAAKETGAEIIVMGARGRGALDRFVFGSTTHDVIRRATCPVLTVHAPVSDQGAAEFAPLMSIVT